MTHYKVQTSADLARLVHHLGARAMPYTVDIKDGVDEKRRQRQNRLAFQWHNDVARQMDGYTVDDARAISKLHCGVGLMLAESQGFRDAWERLIRDRFSYEEKLELMLEPHDYPVTRLMNVKQMATYLDRMQRYWLPQGVTLTDPEMRKYEGVNEPDRA